MLQTFGELVRVPLLGHEAEGLFVVDGVLSRESNGLLHGRFHAFLEGEAVAVKSVPSLCGEDKVEIDEALEFSGETNAFGEAKERHHA